MGNNTVMRRGLSFARQMLPFVLGGAVASGAWAQDAMLPRPVPPPTPKTAKQSEAQLYHTLHDSSFIFKRIPPESEARELQIHDIITVLVDYRASMTSEGDAEARKNSNLNAVLSQWLAFDGKDIFDAPLRRGPLGVNGQLNSQFRTTSDMELRDEMTFRIAAEVVDIRPNGNLVIEARREIRNNEEVWLQSLTGVVRRQSIGPDRTVRSDEVAELRIDKRERGFIKDSYTRGWFLKWYDQWKPF
jgi:flagellar L-ring protein FlgH